MREFDFYKINEFLERKYDHISQELFNNPLYKNNLTSDSKILYAFLIKMHSKLTAMHLVIFYRKFFTN